MAVTGIEAGARRFVYPFLGKVGGMPKHEKVPGTKAIKPNREQRRHPETFGRPENEPLTRDDQPAPPDVPDVRAKKKVTADKWNQ
ncbi:MAG: hypothetical protein ABUS54_07700 [Actinomycetota bacterium]